MESIVWILALFVRNAPFYAKTRKFAYYSILLAIYIGTVGVSLEHFYRLMAPYRSDTFE